MHQLRALRDEIDASFGASVLSPESSAEQFAFFDANPPAETLLWGANLRRDSAPTLKLRLLRVDAAAAQAAPQAYTIDCGAEGISLCAATEEGAASACATLLQLLYFSWDGWRFMLPACSIQDEPIFSWRGFMIDTARHFIPLEDLKRLLSLAHIYKLNRFHWHLSDDQGWRIELLNKPRATGVGSMREGGDPNRNGFYTQDQVRELVAYASDRGITIIPELDLPGHARSILAGDPDLACTQGPHTVWTSWGIADDVLCMGNPRSLEFTLAAWDEVCELFPGPYVHIGGDECPTSRWEACPRCASRKKELNLANWVDLHGNFLKEVASHLQAKGKIVFGWDEVLDSAEENVSNVVHWRAWMPELGALALERGKDLIRAPFSPYYLDLHSRQVDSAVPAWAHKAAHACYPRRVHASSIPWGPQRGDLGRRAPPYGAGAPNGPAATWSRGRFLGIQANAWSEYIRDPRRMDYMLFPRLLALAETAWMGATRPGWDNFHARLTAGHCLAPGALLSARSVNYCPLGL
ncbi:beta-N-acetylhexosaminidase [Treponema sp.]